MSKELYPRDQLIISKLYLPMQALARDFLSKCWEANLDVHLTAGLRTMEEETAYHVVGAAQALPNNSYHIYGLAFDFCFNNGSGSGVHQPYLEPVAGAWKTCADIAKELGLTPGYYFTSFQDKDHVQMKINCPLSQLYPLLVGGGIEAVYNHLEGIKDV